MMGLEKSSPIFMALSDKTFITVAQVKSHLDISASTWDTVFENLIELCTQYAMEYCGGRRFISAGSDTTEYHDGRDTNIIELKNYPVQTITSVSYSSGDYDSPTWTAYNAASDYKRDMTKGLLYFASIDKGIQNIRVVYDGGYADASAVPWDIKGALIKMVSKEFDKRKARGIASESVGGASVSWVPAFDTDVLAVLDNYKRFL